MDAATGLSGSTLAALIALVRKHTGIAMTERKRTLLERRLRPRIDALQLDDYAAYLAHVERDSAELPHFIDLVTTNDTLFFRTPQIWDYLAGEFLPQWARAHPGKRLQIWSAAAASGEEMYSMAMLCEEFQAVTPGFSYRILATDISQQMLARAGAGQFAGRSVERIRQSHPALVAKYFSSHGASLDIRASLKQHIDLVRHNLLMPLPGATQFDLVLLRNVLIYFDLDHQEAVLAQTRKSMAPHALLVLGESETIARLNTGYHFERPMVYRMEKADAKADAGATTEKALS